jgi:diguanylate cyclase (GGDEF)-like protein
MRSAIAQVGPGAADLHVMRLRAWQAYGAALVLIVGVFFVLPDLSTLSVCWQVGIGWSGTAAIVAGVRLNRPQSGLAWYLFAFGVFLNSSGIGLEAYLSRGGRGLASPSIVDVFYLGLYPCLVAGLLVLIVQRTARRESASLVDAMTISTGLGLLMWVFIIRPSLGDPSFTPLGQVVTVAYPIGDIVVLAMILRLLIGSGGRGAAYRVLAVAVTTFLAGDVAWAVITQLGLDPGVHSSALLSMIFLAGYGLFGVAALHPSVRSVADHASAPRSRLSSPMLVVLATVSLIAPALLIVEVVRNNIQDGIAIAVGSMSLFLLVITRMAQLFAEVERQTQQLKDLTQVDELTGLPNRRAWSFKLPSAMEGARHTRGRLSVAMLDLDHFKLFNDQYGHPAGDRLLKAVGASWLAQTRDSDLLARFGGEEFILMLPDTSDQTALDILARLRATTPLGQSFSAGLATWDHMETSDELIARADLALYQAKDEGRNRTTIAPAQPPGPQPAPDELTDRREATRPMLIP